MSQPRLTDASLAFLFLVLASCSPADDAESQPFAYRPTGGTPGGGTGAVGSVATGAGGSGVAGTTNCTNVRPTSTEWEEATCDDWARQTTECGEAWMLDNHYCDESCGRCTASNSGGATGSGGATSGSGGVVIDSSCTAGDQQVCNNESGTHCGYTYEYWKDQGSGCLVNTSDGFSVEWSNINNLLGRKGLRPGSSSQVVTYDADYNPSGNSYLCIYGWTRNPLVEYYIVDSWGDWRPPGNEGHQGTMTSDGGTYDIYRVPRTGPSIDGPNTTFTQYWSVRTAKRESGTITVGNHFDAWADLGMNMGSLYEVSMCVEGYQSSGNATVRMSMR
jgi:endo-1,4-beta-xylanase